MYQIREFPQLSVVKKNKYYEHVIYLEIYLQKNPDLRLLILLTILLLPFGSFAQKKTKKGVYDEYWKQQEQLEKFDLKSKEAHKQFQDGKLKLALLTYNEALKLNPKNQKTIAKIRDIKILLQKKFIIKRKFGEEVAR